MDQQIKRVAIVPVSSIKQSRSWAIYGRSGTGKTTFAATFPKPLLLIDVNDRGTESISDIKGIDVARPETWEEVTWLYDNLDRKYKTVVFDTLTQLQLFNANYERRRSKKPILKDIRWGDLTMAEWGNIGAAMKQLITDWRNLPAELVFIAQERTNKTEETQDTDEMLMPEIGPALSPAISSHLNASVAVIANTYISVEQKAMKIGAEDGKKQQKITKINYAMRLGPHPSYITKMRKPKATRIPGSITDPTYKDVVDIIEGNDA